MRRLDARPDGTVYVGDSDVDIATARAAGVACLSVLWGFRSRDELVRAGAGRLLASPEDLPGCFPEK